MKKVLSILCVCISVTGMCSQQELDVLIPAGDISKKVKETAQEINRDYADKKLTVVMIMKGALCVTADLIRGLDIPFELEYIRTSSYGMNGDKRGALTIDRIDQINVKDRDVLIVDDIMDSGATLIGVKEALKNKGARSIKSCILLVKNIARETTYLPEYTMFTIPDRFVIGYGLDFKEQYRGLDGIYAFPE